MIKPRVCTKQSVLESELTEEIITQGNLCIAYSAVIKSYGESKNASSFVILALNDERKRQEARRTRLKNKFNKLYRDKSLRRKTQ